MRPGPVPARASGVFIGHQFKDSRYAGTFLNHPHSAYNGKKARTWQRPGPALGGPLSERARAGPVQRRHAWRSRRTGRSVTGRIARTEPSSHRLAVTLESILPLATARYRQRGGRPPVTQTFQSAISPTFESAGLSGPHRWRVGKPATRQTRKSALRWQGQDAPDRWSDAKKRVDFSSETCESSKVTHWRLFANGVSARFEEGEEDYVRLESFSASASKREGMPKPAASLAALRPELRGGLAVGSGCPGSFDC